MNVFILTRFNIDIQWNTRIIDRNIVRTDTWLEERFRLFEKYTYPSVNAQTYKDFHWICLFGSDTPENYRCRIETFTKNNARIDACYLNAQEAQYYPNAFRQRIKQLADNNDEGLLTIYLDSDDCLRCNYIEKLLEYAKNSDFGTVFSFKYGIQYYEQMNIAVRIPYPNNHFLAYYERMGEKIRTIWGFSHFEIYKYKKIKIHTEENRDEPMWIEVIHGGNVDNDVKMTLSHKLIKDNTLLHSFGLPMELASRWKSYLLFATSFQCRFLGQIVRRTRNKIRQSVSR